MDPRIEERLVEQAKGDASAFSELYDYYFPKVYSYVSYHLSNKNEVEEIVSLTFLKALEKLSTFTWKGFSFSSWLYRIARNNIIDLFRKNKGNRTIYLESLPEGASFVVDDGNLLEDNLINKEEGWNLINAIQDLPLGAKEIIALKFGAGLTNRKIAQILNIKEGTVGSKLYRALRILREILKDENAGDFDSSKTALPYSPDTQNVHRIGARNVQPRK